jgi:hypothetical protein
MSDTRNVKLGVCQLFYDGVDLGYTKGGVEVSVSTETHKVEVDQFGKTPINESIMARTCMVKAPLAETTLANLVAIMPGASLVTDDGDPTIQRVDVTNSVGTDLLSLAKPLILHPQANAASDRSDDFVVFLAGTGGALQFAYKLEEERIFNVEFNGYPSSATLRIFAVGDLEADAKSAVFDETTDIITTSAHGLIDGQGVTFLAATYPNVAGMAFGKLYFARVLSSSTYSLHPTSAAAIANSGKLLFSTTGTTVKLIPI